MLELFVIIIALCSVDHVGLCACFYLPVREREELCCLQCLQHL